MYNTRSSPLCRHVTAERHERSSSALWPRALVTDRVNCTALYNTRFVFKSITFSSAPRRTSAAAPNVGVFRTFLISAPLFWHNKKYYNSALGTRAENVRALVIKSQKHVKNACWREIIGKTIFLDDARRAKPPDFAYIIRKQTRTGPSEYREYHGGG